MIKKYGDKHPRINENSYLSESAVVIGDVNIDEEASVWFNAVLRGDCNSIYIGRGSNVQDNCTLHANEGETSVEIGEYVTVGHNAVLHGCRIGNHSLIGMGAIILDGAEIGEETIIAAGSLITSGKKIPSGVLCMGSPGKVVRELTPDERCSIYNSAKHYIKCSKEYRESQF